MSGRGAGEPLRTLARLRAIPYGAHVPARPRDHVTTEELLAITRSTRDTLYEWVALKLLPRPWVTTGTDDRKLVAAWPSEALERVRFIVAKQRKNLPIDEIATLVETRWPRH
jgi:hypothetical protein